jgi:DnaJ-class molecular chaperone
MKNLKYTKEDCLLCKGSGEIKVSPDDLMLSLAGEFKTCPLCDGKGYLNILNIEELKFKEK